MSFLDNLQKHSQARKKSGYFGY